MLHESGIIKRKTRCSDGAETPRSATQRSAPLSVPDSTKSCRICGEEKSLSEFRKRHGKPDQPCKPCHGEQARAYRLANREKVRDTQRRYREANKEALAQKKAEYHRQNAERIRSKVAQWVEENRERHAENRRRWQELNPEKKREAEANYRRNHRDKIRLQGAKRRAALEAGDVSTDDIVQMYEDQGGLCAYCETPLFGEFHLEHMRPLSRGGVHSLDNLAITCAFCNHSKGAKTVEEFFRAP